MTDLFPVLDWIDFVYFAIPSIVLLAISAVSALMSKRGLAVITGVVAVVIFAFLSAVCGIRCNALHYAQWVRPVCGTLFL